MDYKKKKSLCGMMAFALTAVVLAGSANLKVEAAQEEPQEQEPVKLELTVYELGEDSGENVPMPYTMLRNSVCFTSQAEGLCVDITTDASRKASVLGTKDIELQEKNLLGWHTVGTSDGYEVYNRASSGCSFVYEDAVYNKQYRVKCTHYGNVDGYDEDIQTTSAYTYNYKK